MYWLLVTSLLISIKCRIIKIYVFHLPQNLLFRQPWLFVVTSFLYKTQPTDSSWMIMSNLIYRTFKLISHYLEDNILAFQKHTHVHGRSNGPCLKFPESLISCSGLEWKSVIKWKVYLWWLRSPRWLHRSLNYLATARPILQEVIVLKPIQFNPNTGKKVG